MLVSLWMLASFFLLVCQVTIWIARRLFSREVACVDVAPVAIVLVLCVTCLFACVFDAFGQPVPNNSLLAFLFTCVSIFIFIAKRRRELVSHALEETCEDREGSFFCDAIKPIIPYLLIAFIVALCAFVQFGSSISINFASTDPATHFNIAMNVLESGHLSSDLWFTHYLSARGIELISSVLPSGSEYKAFIMMEVFYFFLSGCTFYCAAKQFDKTDKGSLIALAVTLLYLLGYPLNVLTFGFSYLGMGVILILAIVVVFSAPKRAWCLRCLFAMVLFASLAVCYSLFLPIALLGILGVFISRRRDFFSNHKIASICGMLTALALMIFGVAVIVRSGLVSALSSAGYSYSNLLGDFILPAPVALLGICSMLKDRKGIGLPVSAMTLAAVCSVVVSIILYRGGVFSSYYYFKLYYVMWACILLCTVKGACSLWDTNPNLLYAYSAVWVFIVSLAVSGVDERLSGSHPDLNPSPVSNVLAGVYSCNAREMLSARLSSSEVELWEMADGLRASENDYIPLLGSNIDVYWYQAVTRQYYPQDTRYYYFWLYDQADWDLILIERLSCARYCVVLNAQDLPQSIKDYLSNKETVFSNEEGYICKLN